MKLPELFLWGIAGMVGGRIVLAPGMVESQSVMVSAGGVEIPFHFFLFFYHALVNEFSSR